MAKRFSADQWQAWFLEFERCELTVADFCLSVGVSVQSYYRWRKKFKSLEEDSADHESESGDFVALAFAADKVEIEFPGGSVARVSNDADSLRPLVTILLEQGAAQ